MAPNAPDNASLLQARAIARLLVADGLVADGGQPTTQGAFVRRMGGGAEGRLLLRLDEAEAIQGLEEHECFRLMALLADGSLSSQPAEDTAAEAIYRAALAEQIGMERQAGALLTPAPRPPQRTDKDAWRERQEVVELLERALRAAREAHITLTFEAWARQVLAVERGGRMA